MAILLGIGCGRSPGQADTGSRVDGYGEPVIGEDSGADADDSSAPDARPLDGGADAGDASTPEARPPDGGADAGDASTPDTHPPDAGADGGRPDANPFVCDPVGQMGCETGQKCDLAGGTFACVPSGTLREFQRCQQVQPNACQAGFSCRETFWADYRCARLCDPKKSDCPGEACASERSTSDGNSYWMCQAQNECAPLQQDCLSPSDACYFVVGAGAFCVQPKATTVPDGTTCVAATDCARGSTCLEFRGRTRCYRMCAPASAEQDCGAGVGCTALGNVGPEEVGACGY